MLEIARHIRQYAGMVTDEYPPVPEMRADMVRRAKVYCERTGTALYALGKLLGRGKGFFPDIEGGRNFRVNTYSDVMAWFDANTPEIEVQAEAEPAEVT